MPAPRGSLTPLPRSVSVHSPTLVILAAILSALVTAVLYAVWHFNKNIPGLRLWTLSFLGASVFCATLLARERMPEVPAVVLAQGANALAAYLCWLGSRAYMGRPPIAHRYAAAAIVSLVALSVYFTVAQPHPGARFALAGWFAGVCFLLTARTLAQGGFRRVPARYLLAGVMAFHGVCVLVRPVIFRLAAPSDAGLLTQLSQFVVLEATVALVMIAFGVLMLTNEFVTSELRHLAEIDPLTSVFNRRAFITLLDKGLSNAQRTRAALPVLVMDLDHFKKINDTGGHQCGDDALRHFVDLAHRCLRREDVMGRLGGEEFAIFLPNADGPGAAGVAERLRALVESEPMDAERRRVALTVSIGITLSTSGDSAEAVLQRADEAMYLAKARGRNRVEVVALPDDPVPLKWPRPAERPGTARSAAVL
ncbi:GGDEF domain-containing protein [Acidovorax sp. sif1233]|uniref:GGDEF domain-containing protein n=1 Tax=unclassified Acidovorax TaxID=2684926 RepID=UPI001C43F586|nr:MULTISPECIES: GGDEF domain-containing protein [unclassified Acidovorax]MBV7430181.1 GGDEF domain-containing protein [Acidovorax sp. sif0732]MBV7451574.1 GGDEF domain-containing protein [Acidovorax sp. sif0715]MBV7454655.1 GGDEF domain-containing protein [Acidovorax sp. sif1233]